MALSHHKLHFKLEPALSTNRLGLSISVRKDRPKCWKKGTIFDMPVWCHFFEVYLDVDSTFASI